MLLTTLELMAAYMMACIKAAEHGFLARFTEMMAILFLGEGASEQKAV